MKRVKYTVTALMALCVGLLSACVMDDDGLGKDSEAQELLQPGYSASTRFGISDGKPTNGDTYTIISYRKEYTNSTVAYTERIPDLNYVGFYAYDGSGSTVAGNSGEGGDIVPVKVKATSVGSAPANYYQIETPLTLDRARGQHLPGVPVTGANTNNTGHYYTAMIHPSVPVVNTTEHGYMAVIDREPANKIYASRKGELVEMEVNDNLEIQNLDGIVMKPLMSEVNVYLYSHYYADDDPGHTDLKSIDFEVENASAEGVTPVVEAGMQLVNAGSNGWFNPYTGEVYPNYNYSEYGKTVIDGIPVAVGSDYRVKYSSTLEGVTATGKENYIPLVAVNSKGDLADTIEVEYDDVLGSPVTENAQVCYKVTNLPVFPANYLGEGAGSSRYVVPMTLQLRLKKGEFYSKASVPIALKMEPNHSYTFYINVMSEQILVAYSRYTTENPEGWIPGGGNYDDIGGGVRMDYEIIDIEWKTVVGEQDDWQQGNPGGTNPIGGVNP